MAYIGNKLADAYTSFAKQDFTTSATTSYTLDYPVANANEIALFINFVRQEPTTAYTTSGTSLTLTSATSASDDMYCVFLGKALQTVNPPAGSVGASQIADGSIALGKLSATGTKDSTTFLRGDNTFASAGGTMTPAFHASLSASQSISNNVTTKIQFEIERFDSDSCYDNATNYRFTPTTAGKYYIYLGVSGQTGDQQQFTVDIYKNGSRNIFQRARGSGTGNMSAFTAAIINFNGTTDYVEGFITHEFGSSASLLGNAGGSIDYTFFGGYKIIE